MIAWIALANIYALYLRPVLRFFKNDNITTLIPLLLVAALMRIGVWLGHVVPPDTEQLGGLLYNDWLAGLEQSPIISALLTMFLVVIQGFLINRLVQEFRFVRERSSLFALLYVVFASMLPEFLFVSPALIATTFVCFSLTHILALYRSKSPSANIFDAVFFIVLGALFYPLVFWILPAYVVGLALFHSIRLSDLTVFVSGIFVPNFLAWGICYLRNTSDDFWDYTALLSPRIPQGLLRDGFSLTTYNLGLVLLLFFLLWVLLSFGSYFSRKLMQVKKYITFLYWFLLFAVLSYFFQSNPQHSHALLFAPAMGILLGHSFQYTRNKIVAELGILLLIVAALAIQFFPSIIEYL